MKTAISLPTAMFERAERVADRLGLSRSRLYTLALAQYLDEIDRQVDPVTEALDQLYEEQSACEKDPAGAAAGRRMIDEGDWQW